MEGEKGPQKGPFYSLILNFFKHFSNIVDLKNDPLTPILFFLKVVIMSKKLSHPRTKKGPKKETSPTPAEQIQHYNAVLIEDLKSEFRFVVEHMSGVEQRLTTRMDKTDALNGERFDRIEAVLKMHSQMFRENERRWEENDKRWDQNDKRWEQNDRHWEENEKRWERMELKLDHVAEKVERHDREISEIKSHLTIP